MLIVNEYSKRLGQLLNIFMIFVSLDVICREHFEQTMAASFHTLLYFFATALTLDTM
jgi:hypothetical protein